MWGNSDTPSPSRTRVGGSTWPEVATASQGFTGSVRIDKVAGFSVLGLGLQDPGYPHPSTAACTVDCPRPVLGRLAMVHLGFLRLGHDQQPRNFIFFRFGHRKAPLPGKANTETGKSGQVSPGTVAARCRGCIGAESLRINGKRPSQPEFAGPCWRSR